MSGKAVHVEGAGIGQTNIVLAGGGFSMSGSSAGNNLGVLGNISWSGSASSDGWLTISSSFRFRLHHMAIGDISNRAIMVVGSYGLIDHMTFTTNKGYNAIQVLGSLTAPSGRWSQPMDFGSADAVYIEDSTFTADNCVTGLVVFDGGNGAKIVFRHNVVTNWQSAVHGYDTWPESTLRTEIYNNTFDMAKTMCNIDRMIFIRGGTGYVFNNKMRLADSYNTYSPAFLSLYYYRDSVAQQGSVCNGAAAIDQNIRGMNGYICFQQPGTGGPGPFTSVPWYEYNNTGIGNMPANLQIRNESSHVAMGRDYFQDTPMPGYVPYSYPHPLQSGTPPVSVVPAAPTSLSATVR